jgi:hypothetical protein
VKSMNEHARGNKNKTKTRERKTAICSDEIFREREMKERTCVTTYKLQH